MSAEPEAAPFKGDLEPVKPLEPPEPPVAPEAPEVTRLVSEAAVQSMPLINGTSTHKPSDYLVVVRSPDGTECTIPLENPLIIGKSEECDVTVPDDQYLSRQHARLEVAGNQVVIQDLNSSNGCFVRVKELTFLQPGDQIILGSTLLRIETRLPELITRAG